MGRSLEELYGTLEAYRKCPKTMNRPFLPYRNKNGGLLFPTGEWVGVYYSEELKYAKKLGYTVVPLRGYLFKQMESPFVNFGTSMFENRKKAKIEGNEALSYVYKMIMNTLYGRFGINPKCSVTEIATLDRYKEVLKSDELIFAELLNPQDETYVLSYWSLPDSTFHSGKPTRNAAVQLS